MKEQVIQILLPCSLQTDLCDQVKRDWENFFMGQSYRISDYYGRYMLTDNLWTLDQKLPEVPLVTVEKLQQHIALLLSKVNMRILINGNMYKDVSAVHHLDNEILMNPFTGSYRRRRDGGDHFGSLSYSSK